MAEVKKRFSGIGSISNPAQTIPSVCPPSPLTKAPMVSCLEPLYADLFRASLVRVAAVYSAKPALVSFMNNCDGGFAAAAARFNVTAIQNQLKISKGLQDRAGKLAVAGKDLSEIEDSLVLWEESESRLMDLLDKATVHSQLRLL